VVPAPEDVVTFVVLTIVVVLIVAVVIVGEVRGWK
jgi:nitrate reductase NapE component